MPDDAQNENDDKALHDLLSLLFQSHPWHGVEPGDEAPDVVRAYIEIVPTDAVKYELDKFSGHLRLDRPQRFSSFPPTLYGFIPQTFCGEQVAAFSKEKTHHSTVEGDGDPMDICILSEKAFSHGDFLLQAVPVGGLRLVDRNQADDKIVAVLKGDAAFGHCREIGDLPPALIDRLKHYFLTYKQLPNEGKRKVEIAEVYDRAEAHEVIRRSMKDYARLYGASRAAAKVRRKAAR